MRYWGLGGLETWKGDPPNAEAGLSQQGGWHAARTGETWVKLGEDSIMPYP